MNKLRKHVLMNGKSIADKIIISIRNTPERWSLWGSYRIRHENKYTLWIGSGILFVRLDYEQSNSEASTFSVWERWKIWIAYRWWRKYHLKIGDKTEEIEW